MMENDIIQPSAVPFSLDYALEILTRTPDVIDSMVRGLSTPWLYANEGPDTWSVYDVIGHLVHGEQVDWMDRMTLILSDSPDKTFAKFNRKAQFEDGFEQDFTRRLELFRNLRAENLAKLASYNLTTADFDKEGIHPALGVVTLRHLIATWAVHDLTHQAQIVRVLAHQYGTFTGPFSQFLGVLQERAQKSQ